MTDSVLFCTPCYGGMLTAQHFQSCMNLKEELTRAGVAHDWLIGWNESLVHRARNEMTATFLKSGHSHMMWLDADIVFEPEGVAALWNLRTDIAVAFYAMKRLGNPIAAWRGGKLVDLGQCPAEPFEVDFAGTGFMLIRREVIEALVERAQRYEGPNGVVPLLYDTMIHNGIFESEDYNFCRKAREAGFKILGNPAIRLGHIGQFVYGA
jgi:hypothetical protein